MEDGRNSDDVSLGQQRGLSDIPLAFRESWMFTAYELGSLHVYYAGEFYFQLLELWGN